MELRETSLRAAGQHSRLAAPRIQDRRILLQATQPGRETAGAAVAAAAAAVAVGVAA